MLQSRGKQLQCTLVADHLTALRQFAQQRHLTLTSVFSALISQHFGKDARLEMMLCHRIADKPYHNDQGFFAPSNHFIMISPVSGSTVTQQSTAMAAQLGTLRQTLTPELLELNRSETTVTNTITHRMCCLSDQGVTDNHFALNSFQVAPKVVLHHITVEQGQLQYCLMIPHDQASSCVEKLTQQFTQLSQQIQQLSVKESAWDFIGSKANVLPDDIEQQRTHRVLKQAEAEKESLLTAIKALPKKFCDERQAGKVKKSLLLLPLGLLALRKAMTSPMVRYRVPKFPLHKLNTMKPEDAQAHFEKHQMPAIQAQHRDQLNPNVKQFKKLSQQTNQMTRHLGEHAFHPQVFPHLDQAHQHLSKASDHLNKGNAPLAHASLNSYSSSISAVTGVLKKAAIHPAAQVVAPEISNTASSVVSTPQLNEQVSHHSIAHHSVGHSDHTTQIGASSTNTSEASGSSLQQTGDSFRKNTDQLNQLSGKLSTVNPDPSIALGAGLNALAGNGSAQGSLTQPPQSLKKQVDGINKHITQVSALTNGSMGSSNFDACGTAKKMAAPLGDVCGKTKRFCKQSVPSLQNAKKAMEEVNKRTQQAGSNAKAAMTPDQEKLQKSLQGAHQHLQTMNQHMKALQPHIPLDKVKSPVEAVAHLAKMKHPDVKLHVDGLKSACGKMGDQLNQAKNNPSFQAMQDKAGQAQKHLGEVQSAISVLSVLPCDAMLVAPMWPQMNTSLAALTALVAAAATAFLLVHQAPWASMYMELVGSLAMLQGGLSGMQGVVMMALMAAKACQPAWQQYLTMTTGGLLMVNGLMLSMQTPMLNGPQGMLSAGMMLGAFNLMSQMLPFPFMQAPNLNIPNASSLGGVSPLMTIRNLVGLATGCACAILAKKLIDSSQEMAVATDPEETGKQQLVVNGAMIRCTGSEIPSVLMMAKKPAVEKDGLGEVLTQSDSHLMPLTFGTCTFLPPEGPVPAPCMPSTQKWVLEMGEPKMKIASSHVLTHSAQMFCVHGGMISIENSGQHTDEPATVDVDLLPKPSFKDRMSANFSAIGQKISAIGSSFSSSLSRMQQSVSDKVMGAGSQMTNKQMALQNKVQARQQAMQQHADQAGGKVGDGLQHASTHFQSYTDSANQRAQAATSAVQRRTDAVNQGVQSHSQRATQAVSDRTQSVQDSVKASGNHAKSSADRRGKSWGRKGKSSKAPTSPEAQEMQELHSGWDADIEDNA